MYTHISSLFIYRGLDFERMLKSFGFLDSKGFWASLESGDT